MSTKNPRLLMEIKRQRKMILKKKLRVRMKKRITKLRNTSLTEVKPAVMRSLRIKKMTRSALTF